MKDFSGMGVLSCVLGYADNEVNNKVLKKIKNASMTSLNDPDEVKLAEMLINLHPWSDMVRFAKTGGEACAIAIRIARAATGKDKVLFCGYHGWQDWYISSNLSTQSWPSRTSDTAANVLFTLPHLATLGLPVAFTRTGRLSPSSTHAASLS